MSWLDTKCAPLLQLLQLQGCPTAAIGFHPFTTASKLGPRPCLRPRRDSLAPQFVVVRCSAGLSLAPAPSASMRMRAATRCGCLLDSDML